MTNSKKPITIKKFNIIPLIPKILKGIEKLNPGFISEIFNEQYLETIHAIEEPTVKNQFLDTEYDFLSFQFIEWFIADFYFKNEYKETVQVSDLLQDKKFFQFTKHEISIIQKLKNSELNFYKIIQIDKTKSILTLTYAFPPKNKSFQTFEVYDQLASKSMLVGFIYGLRLIPWVDKTILSGVSYLLRIEENFENYIEYLNEKVPKDYTKEWEIRFHHSKKLVNIALDDMFENFCFDKPDPVMPKIQDAETGDLIELIKDIYEIKDMNILLDFLESDSYFQRNKKNEYVMFTSIENKDTKRVKAHLKIQNNNLFILSFTSQKAEDTKKYLQVKIKQAVVFKLRQIENIQQALKSNQSLPSNKSMGSPTDSIKTQTELKYAFIKKYYDDWAFVPIPALGNKKPIDAIKTISGKKKTFEIIESYIENDRRQALAENRETFSFQFLYDQLGIKN